MDETLLIDFFDIEINSPFCFLLQAGFYYVLTIIFGIFLAIIWGLFMGINYFFIIWLVNPSIKIMFTWFRVFYLMLRSAIRTLLDPFFETFAIIFSNIKGNFSLDARGIPAIPNQAAITYP